MHEHLCISTYVLYFTEVQNIFKVLSVEELKNDLCKPIVCITVRFGHQFRTNLGPGRIFRRHLNVLGR